MSLRRRAAAGASVGGTRATGRIMLPRRSSSGRVIKENLKYGRPHAVFERIFDPDEMTKGGTDYTGLAPILQLESLSELPDFGVDDTTTCLLCCAPCGAKPQLAATLNQLSQILNSSAEHPANLLSSVLNYDVSQLEAEEVLCEICSELFTQLRVHESEIASLREQLMTRVISGAAGGGATIANGHHHQQHATTNTNQHHTTTADVTTEVTSQDDVTAATAGGTAVVQALAVSCFQPDEAAVQLSHQFSCGLLGLTAFATPVDDDEFDDDDEDGDGLDDVEGMQDDDNDTLYEQDEDERDEEDEDEEEEMDEADELDYNDEGIMMANRHHDNTAAEAGSTTDRATAHTARHTSATAIASADDITDDIIAMQQNNLSCVRGRVMPASDKWTADGDESPQLPCPLCPRIFLTEPERRQHTEQHMNERLNCELCSETVLRRHMPAHRAKHGVTTVKSAGKSASSAATAAGDSLTCAFCNKRYDSQARLNVHVKIRHGRSAASACSTAPSSAAMRGGRRPRGRPRRTDALAPRPGTCQYCGVYIKVDLQGHVNRFHTMVRPFECATCGQRLVSRHALAEHRQVFHSEGHRCQLCGMTFARKKQLSVHAWKRHGVGGVTCRVCGKSFARSDTLDGHMRCHQRPLACQLCPARFPFKRELRNHEHLRHGLHGEIPADNDYLPGEAYRCAKCGRCYGSWAARDRHTCDGTALSDLFVCQLCGDWSTRFEGDMVKHMRNLHNIEADTILIADVEQSDVGGVTDGEGVEQEPAEDVVAQVVVTEETQQVEGVVDDKARAIEQIVADN